MCCRRENKLFILGNFKVVPRNALPLNLYLHSFHKCISTEFVFKPLHFFFSLEEKQESLNRRQKNLLSEWDTRKTEVSDWLTDMSTKVKAQDSPAANVDAARDQNQKLQVR